MLRQKSARLDVVEHELEDFRNEFAGFKKQVAGVFRKYDKNFRETAAAHQSLHQGWFSHQAEINLINERCTCRASNSEDEFATMESVSLPSPIETPVTPELVPLQVAPTYQVGWVTRHQFVKPIDLSIADASPSGDDSIAFESGGLSSTWPSEGCPLVS